MKEQYQKYASLLLKKCLNIKKGQPLLITTPIESYEFIRTLTKQAYELGITDIYIDWEDEEIMHQQLKYLEKKELKQSNYWNKKIYNTYAEKNSAILILKGNNPDKMNDISPERLSKIEQHLRNSYPIYRKKQLNYEIPWCIALVSTEELAKKIFPKSKTPKQELWNQIFTICHIDDENPNQYWDEKIKRNNKRTKWLESLNIKKLHYSNSIGTNLTVGISPNSKWIGTEKQTQKGPIIVNMPGEEVFTSPIKTETNGIVYSTKPLVYGGTTINNFNLTFQNGKVIKIQAEQGEEILKKIIKETEGADMLGEIALVDYNSPISQSKIIFYNTLYDENASCHLALGDSFKDTIENEKQKLNQSKEHIDFMIGTKDLKIMATTIENKEITIFENGNFIDLSE